MPKPEKIVSYLHCRQCFDELPNGESPVSYARVSVGWTNNGTIQVWCNRHDKEVAELGVAPGRGRKQPAMAVVSGVGDEISAVKH